MENRIRNLIVPFALGLTLAACEGSQKNNSFTHFSVVDDTHVAIHARGAADAILAADGSLSIDGKILATTPPQQGLLEGYYRGIDAMRRDAIATGAAGIATAGTAIVSVVSGLASGDPDSIGPKVDAKAAKVDAAAAKLCADLEELRKQQEAIVVQLDAFRPYASIGTSETEDCASH
ncbi:MAG: hypothetical protein ABIO49_00800 [Dokdonella sp.]